MLYRLPPLWKTIIPTVNIWLLSTLGVSIRTTSVLYIYTYYRDAMYVLSGHAALLSE